MFLRNYLQGFCFFFIRNSRLNCRIIESIFDMSLVYLHNYMYACSVVHVTRICCFELSYLKFSFGYLKNSLLRIAPSRIFKKGCEVFAWNPMKNLSKSRQLFMENSRNKGRLSTNFICITFAQYCSHSFAIIEGSYHSTNNIC